MSTRQRNDKVKEEPQQQNKVVVDSDNKNKQVFDKVPHEFFGFRILRFIAILVWAITATIIIWISVPINYLIDPILKKYKVKRYYYPLEILSRCWAIGILWVLNIQVKTEGFEIYKDYKEQPSVLMYSHSSYLDPIVLQGYSPIPCKYIYKRELIYIFPLLFLLAYIVGHIPINRSAKQSAISSINEAAAFIEKQKRCIGIAPEGTRSKDGILKEFKKGPFHLAMNSNSQIIPVVFFGNNLIWSASTFFPHSGNLVIRCLPPVKINKNESVDAVSEKVRSKMLESLCSRPKNYSTFKDPSIIHTVLYLGLVSWLTILTLTYFGFL